MSGSPTVIVTCAVCGETLATCETYAPFWPMSDDEESAAWDDARAMERYDTFMDHAIDATADHVCPIPEESC